MDHSNGNVLMRESVSPSTLSPKTFSPAKSMASSTFDDASLDELDRIMDTLSTLSRETSMVRDRNDNRKFIIPSRTGSDQTVPRSMTGSENTTPFPNSPEHMYSGAMSPSIPPPMTSPPRTPVAQSPRHYVSHPKVMTLSAIPSNNINHHFNEERSPATIPRLPHNPYENTSILHGSHFSRPANTTSNNKPVSYPNPMSESPLVGRNQNGDNRQNYFFGPLPVSNQGSTYDQYPPPTGPKPTSMIPTSSYDQEPFMEQVVPVQAEVPPRSPINRNHEIFIGGRRMGASNEHAMTLPAYNEKRSYLKNLEEGTLPRPRVDSSRNDTPQNLTLNAAKILNAKPKNSVNEDSEGLTRLSLRRHSNKSSKRANGKFNLQNLSKTPSRHSTSSFNSFDMGRGYASVSTAPASTHGLIQTEVLPHRRKDPNPLPTSIPESSNPSKKDRGNCCVRSGRFLYSNILEMFILVAFCAGLPVGIVLQATAFHASPAFTKYFTFWGSTMLPAVLSTITPLLVFSSILTGVANFTTSVIKRFSLVAILFYSISVAVAACIAIVLTLVIKPGAMVGPFAAPEASTIPSNISQMTEEIRWPDATLLAQQGFLKDDGLSVLALKPSSYFYNTSQAADITTSDEILRLISLFLPGCGIPAEQETVMCNLFVLMFLAGVMGIGASCMGVEGSQIRHMIAQIGVVMSNMSEIIMWYLPIGVLFYVSELVATRVDWANIGHDRPPPTGRFGNNNTEVLNGVYEFNNATKWYFVTVISSLSVYSLVLMPLVVSVLTLTNPFSLLGFRSLGPLLTATTTGFSDLCIPVTARCLLKERHLSGCCIPHSAIDRRVARVSAVLGGLFHRGGSAIVIICSSLFLVQMSGQQITCIGTILICLSSLVTSVTSIGGRWFFGTDPYMRAMVISMSSAGMTSPATIPRAVLYLWLISRFAAFADTFVDLLGAHLLNRACKSQLQDGALEQDSLNKNSAASSNVDTNASVMATPSKKNERLRSMCGETSDYEDAPLLFNRTGDTENESVSGNSRAGVASNDDSVFLPNRPQDKDKHTNNPTTAAVNNAFQLKQDGSVSTNQNAMHSKSSNHHAVGGTNQNGGPGVLANQNTRQESKAANIPGHRDEVSFVTF